MRKSNLASSVGTNSKSSQQLIAARKIEGMDMKTAGSPHNNRVLSSSGTNYRKSIEAIKTRTRTKDIEDEYIRGLQDQVKFLEYELKLLRDKEMEQHSAAQQLGKFFDDGVPINENILAMKNCFTSQKADLQSKCKELSAECRRKHEFIEAVTKEIEKLREMGGKMDAERIVREEGMANRVGELTKKYQESARQCRVLEENNRELQLKNKKLNQDLSFLRRNTQMDTIFDKQDLRNSQISTIRTQLLQRDKQIAQLQSQRQLLRSKVQDNTLFEQLTESNADLKRKILSVGKEINLLSTKIQEVTYDCENKMKEREEEAAQKREVVGKLQKLKQKLDYENMMTEQDMEKKILEKETVELREVDRKKQSLNKYILFQKAEAEKLQREAQELLYAKTDLQQKVTEVTNQTEHLQTLIKAERAREIELYSSVEALTAIKDTLQSLKQPLPLENQKMSQRFETLKKSIEELEKQNNLKNKQLQLIKELKSFNLDEVKLIRSTSSNIQDSIVTFLKRWDSIQRNDLSI